MLASCGAKLGIAIRCAIERHRADPEREPEERHPDRQAHGDHRAERHEQDDDRGDDADQLADPDPGVLERGEQIAAQLDLERRARSLLVGERLQAVEVGEAQLLEHRILDPDHGHAAVGRHDAARVEDVRQCGRAALELVEGGAATRTRQAGVTTTWAVRPARSEPAAPSMARASAESDPGASNVSSRSRPNPAEAATTSTATASHAQTVAHGRRAARRPRR